MQLQKKFSFTFSSFANEYLMVIATHIDNLWTKVA